MSDNDQLPIMGEKFPQKGSRLFAWIGRTYLKLRGWRVTGEFPNTNKLIIAVAPHTSNWDFPLGLAVKFALRLDLSFMGKHTLFQGPFGWMFRAFGGIPIERSKAHGVVAQMVEQFQKRENLVLALAPEGTRKRVDKWKTGFLQIAAQAKVPVLLVGIDYKKKEIVIGETRQIGDNIPRELQSSLAFFATVTGKHPENCNTVIADNSGVRD